MKSWCGSSIEEEDVAEQMQRGEDAATLMVEREAAGPLMQGQVEGLVAGAS